MQYTKNFCFINEVTDYKTTLILLDRNYKILQYKVLNKDNQCKLNNIYCGIIDKIDYSIESIFVKISDETIGFLPFKQLNFSYYDKTKNCLKKKLNKGEKILVQVIRDSVGDKSLKLTNNISVSGIYSVLIPFNEIQHGVSSHVKAEQRTLIKNFLKVLKTDGSVMIRSSAAECSIKDIEEDLISLKNLFDIILKNFQRSKNAKLLFKNDELVHILRSYSLSLIETVFVKNKKMSDLLNCYNDKNLIKLPKIEIKNDYEFLKLIEYQIDMLHKKELLLPSQGSIVIEKTEAMITIDVNSKKFLKGKNMEDTSFKVNIESVELIVQQIILRNLGGIICIDLIDMKNEKNIQTVYEKFKHEFKRDRASVKILPINELGVLQLSRERKGLSLFNSDYIKCNFCENGLKLSLNFLLSDFIDKISKYETNDFLQIKINIELFNLIFSNYFYTIQKFKNIRWNILTINNFEISCSSKVSQAC